MQIGRERPACLMSPESQKRGAGIQKSGANARPVPDDSESHDWHLASRGLINPEKLAAQVGRAWEKSMIIANAG